MIDEILTPRLALRRMSEKFLQASLDRDVAAAEAMIGLRIPPDWFAAAEFMRMRLDDLAKDPAYREWAPRAIGLRAGGEMVGYIGFHSAPDPAYLREIAPGAVEFGYTVFAAQRRRGYAQEASRGLMRWAAEARGVRRFVLSIAPGNVASQRIAATFGFRKIGEHMDERDGPEDILLLDGAALDGALAG